MTPKFLPTPVPAPILRLALLHLAAIPGDLAHNRQLVETAVVKAAELGADWIVTPELCVLTRNAPASPVSRCWSAIARAKTRRSTSVRRRA